MKTISTLLNRRDLLNLGVAAASMPVAVTNRRMANASDPRRFRIVDTNVSLFRWPFRRLPLDETGKLVSKLRSLGIDQAWAGSFEAILHRDLTAANRRLAQVCRAWPELIPIGSINLQLPDWEGDLKCCLDRHQMPGVRVYPNYHGYRLDDPRFARLVELVCQAGRFLQIATAMEDTRTQHRLVRVADVDLAPLVDVMPKFADARVQLLNYRPGVATLKRLAKLPGLYFDTSRVEATDGVPQLVRQVPEGQVLLGTNAPLLIPEAAMVRVHESGQLDDAGLRSVLGDNADRLLKANA